jgi:FkbM family methyltransferase
MSAPARNRLRWKLVERVSSPTPLARRIKDFGTELRGATAFAPASRPRYWADAIAFRFLRLAPVLASERVRTIVLRDGTKLSYRLNRGDIQAIREVWLTPTYLPPSPRDRIGVCVDIGANIGFATLYFARHHGAGECVVVEPDAGNAGLLRRNLEQNGIRAVVLEAAVGRSDGVGRFAQSQESNLGRLAEAGVPVNVLSMPSVLANVEGRRVDLLKVDIEGGEAELFAGDTSWLDRVDAIVIEFHQEVTAPAPIISRITAHGFRHVPSDSMREGTTDAFVR